MLQRTDVQYVVRLVDNERRKVCYDYLGVGDKDMRRIETNMGPGRYRVWVFSRWAFRFLERHGIFHIETKILDMDYRTAMYYIYFGRIKKVEYRYGHLLVETVKCPWLGLPWPKSFNGIEE